MHKALKVQSRNLHNVAKFVEVLEMVQVADICSPGLVVKLVNKVAESIVIR